MSKFKRIFLIVIDSLGIGFAPDAKDYGDEGSNTLGHIAKYAKNFAIPNLQKLGIANLCDLKGINPVENPLGAFCKLSEKSVGKDTMTGHWEMMGVTTKEPFITFTETGFPKELIDEIEKYSGRKVVGNKSASGTEIIDEFADEEINNNSLIVYTSADSVLQICGNEETMGLEKLYDYCKFAREITMKEQWKVGRIIARPYTGLKKGEFKRTSNRHDYALSPPHKTTLDRLSEKGFATFSIGKINDIFNGQGITEYVTSKSSVQGMEQTIEAVKNKDFTGLCFTNLVDFDALWGHRRNIQGYADELMKFDEKLGELLAVLKDNDLVMITADHGTDPSFKGSDHTREYVPLIMYGKNLDETGKIPDHHGFMRIGEIVEENFFDD